MPARPSPRADLAAIAPYSTSPVAPGVQLHANESPYPLPADLMDALAAELRKLDLNRYPQLAAEPLRAALADYAGVDPDWISLGTGSNEVLLECCLAYGGPGRTALTFEPTYRMQHKQAMIPGTRVVSVPRGAGYAVDVEAALGEIEREQPDIVFVCTPNNPTGTLTPLDDLRALAGACPGVFLVDEAYFEFSGVTFVPCLREFPNVIVVRTMSKAFRLAGARLGYAVAQPETLAPLRQVRMPYAQSALAQTAARLVLERREEVLAAVPMVVAERKRLSRELSSLPGVTAFPSEANFVLFRVRRSAEIARALAEAGVIVRDFTTLEGAASCLRVTAGTPEENDAFLEALRGLL